MSKRPKKLDLNQLAKRIVDEAAGDVTSIHNILEKGKAADEQKRLDGAKGAKKRAKNLTPEQRSEIASIAASARWHKVD